jgi:hypothetical protein
MIDACQSGGALESLRRVAIAKNEQSGATVAVIAAADPLSDTIQQSSTRLAQMATRLVQAMGDNDTLTIRALLDRMQAAPNPMRPATSFQLAIMEGDDFPLR